MIQRTSILLVLTALLGGCASPAPGQERTLDLTKPPLFALAAPFHFGIGSSTSQSVGAPAPSPAAQPEPVEPQNAGDADVVMHEYVKMEVGGVAETGEGHAVLLIDEPREQGLVIFIGDTEALSIKLRLQHLRFQRPLTHDLIDDMLRRFGSNVRSVRVDRVEDEIYYGTIVLQHGNQQIELDARTSDAIALAVGSNAPIHVAKAVLSASGVDLDEMRQEWSSDPDGDVQPTPTDFDQRSDSVRL